MNKHQIRRIDSYVRLSWKTQEDCWRAQQECSSGRIYIGASGRINNLPSNAKQINKKESHDNQLRARRSACNGQSRDTHYQRLLLFTPMLLTAYIIIYYVWPQN